MNRHRPATAWLISVAACVAISVGVAEAHAQPGADYSGSCTASGCHDGYAKRSVVHGPIAMDACDSCHEETGKAVHKFRLIEEGADLCLDCHDEGFSGKVQHAPAADGQCTTCHDPHASDAKNLLQAATIAELCAECHEEITEDRTFLHGPVAAGACTSCHNPHSSDHPALLAATGPKVCTKCHETFVARLADSAFSHQPVRDDCTACHDAHGGDNKMNLSSIPPDLCLDCHDDIADAIDDASVEHSPVTSGKGCTNCHDPHASPIAHGLLLKSMDLCLSCHDKELDSGSGKIANIAQLLADNPMHHGPVAQEDCVSCHNPHGGANFRMLTEAYPRSFYSPFEEEHYAMCFSCHEAEMLEDEETDDLTNFRNGERNLHYLHVNRPVKGRTCRACHNPHASSKPKLIADSVPFGEWRIPTSFEQTPTGGSCAPGCHRLYRYDRETPVTNLPQGAPQASNVPAAPSN